MLISFETHSQICSVSFQNLYACNKVQLFTIIIYSFFIFHIHCDFERASLYWSILTILTLLRLLTVTTLLFPTILFTSLRQKLQCAWLVYGGVWLHTGFQGTPSWLRHLSARDPSRGVGVEFFLWEERNPWHLWHLADLAQLRNATNSRALEICFNPLLLKALDHTFGCKRLPQVFLNFWHKY